MKKMSAIIVFCFLLASMSITFAQESSPVPTQKGTYTVAIIPYINATEEKQDYIKETIDSKYTEQFSNDKFHLASAVDIQKVLSSTGFDASNMELPEKDVMASVAKQTNADYVIAMELSQLITTRHMSFFQAKVVTKTKLRYKFYNAKQDKIIPFQTTGISENKTVFGGVGFKDPIVKALNEAMDNANIKITENL